MRDLHGGTLKKILHAEIQASAGTFDEVIYTLYINIYTHILIYVDINIYVYTGLSQKIRIL